MKKFVILCLLLVLVGECTSVVAQGGCLRCEAINRRCDEFVDKTGRRRNWANKGIAGKYQCTGEYASVSKTFKSNVKKIRKNEKLCNSILGFCRSCVSTGTEYTLRNFSIDNYKLLYSKLHGSIYAPDTEFDANSSLETDSDSETKWKLNIFTDKYSPLYYFGARLEGSDFEEKKVELFYSLVTSVRVPFDLEIELLEKIIGGRDKDPVSYKYTLEEACFIINTKPVGINKWDKPEDLDFYKKCLTASLVVVMKQYSGLEYTSLDKDFSLEFRRSKTCKLGGWEPIDFDEGVVNLLVEFFK